MNQPKPNLIIIAGPNGSGKSTLTRRTLRDSNLPVIDPDAIAREINPTSPESAAIRAGREAINQINNYLDNNQSFIAETTLSGNNYLKVMDKAKKKGFEVSLIYIGVDNVNTNISRVQLRARRGGHNVPPDDIRRRYERSMNNLAKALEIANSSTIYDNSAQAEPKEILLLENNQIVQSSNNIPQWVTQAVPQELFDSYSNRLNIALQIYPTINQVRDILNDRLIEVEPNVQKLEGSKYNVIINNNTQKITLLAKDDRNNLFIYNQRDNQMIFVSSINNTDISTWLAISEQLNNTNKQRTSTDKDIEI
ncbi:MAG: AAA family ATPase [Richelia sp. RM2_1_2]|nr:AAA family ATPase [Richelia sp. SM2_1_7]NJM17359.1 AAA family ATPase [Richelia sp. SM1_7_0]NJN09472.1 AAA family ATPase [Richelia sp. RM1_1_1]NJO26869.1 AAA family ATPase [Richelia sp. SL_2_1]NJO58737.1 AAA family ATPase [Richelia sp. RM2_1_2]